MDAQNQAKLDARRSEFEELKERIDELPEVVIDFEPGEVYFPAIYNPATFPGPEQMPSWYGVTIPASRILTEVDSHVASWLLGNVRPAAGHCPFERLHLKSKHRPEVYTISSHGKGDNYHEDLDSLHTQLTRLDVRNRPRDHLFIGRRVRVHAKPYAYWSGSLHFDRQGVGMGLRKIGIWP